MIICFHLPKLRGGIFLLLEQENKEQAKVRELEKQEKDIDILPDLSELAYATVSPTWKTDEKVS